MSKRVPRSVSKLMLMTELMEGSEGTEITEITLAVSRKFIDEVCDYCKVKKPDYMIQTVVVNKVPINLINNGQMEEILEELEELA